MKGRLRCFHLAVDLLLSLQVGGRSKDVGSPKTRQRIVTAILPPLYNVFKIGPDIEPDD